ncbi:MAG: cupredoxin domain-containing protein [Dehalococcoidia bacterium]
MPSKGKKRREARRLRKQRQEERAAAGEGVVEDAAAEEDSTPEPVEEVPRKRVRKKRKKRAGPRFRINGWLIGTPIAIVGVIAVAFLVLTSGSSGVTAPTVETTPDPRVKDLPIVKTIQVEAGGGAADAFFSPRNITGPAGEAFEIVVTNTGSLSHNLTIAGVDEEYDTSDDWMTDPLLITPGEQGSVVVKIDEPGTYAFKCIIHPVQTGELTIQ